MKFITCYLLLFLPLVLLGQNSDNPPPKATDFDWKAATELFRKSKQGGELTAAEKTILDEAKRRRRAGERPGKPAARPDDLTRGDGTADRSPRNPRAIRPELAPVRELDVRSKDGKELSVAVRRPTGKGPFPAILFFHGGMNERPYHKLEHEALNGRTHNEFLRRGFVCVTATYRKYDMEPRSRGPIEDAAAIVRSVAALEYVDAKSVVTFGGSGGGSIVLDLAGEPDLPLAAVVAGEPATVIYTGILETYAKRNQVMDEEVSGYTPEIKARTEKKIASIKCPVLIHHGDQHPLKHINFKIIIPALKAAEKEYRVESYPGAKHGFYWTGREDMMTSTMSFLKPHLKTAPKSWTP